MGVHTLSLEVRGFIYNFFNDAANVFRAKAPELAAAEAGVANALSFDFMCAAGDARMGGEGDEAKVSQAIDALVTKVNRLTDPGLIEAVDEILDRQKLYVRHFKPQQKKDLGSYSNGIF